MQDTYLKSSYFSNDTDGAHAGISMKWQEEWERAGLYWGTRNHVSPSTGLVYGGFHVEFSRRRLPNYMLHKAVYLTLLCAYFGLCSCVVPSADLVGRLSLLLSLFFTIYAIQWFSVDWMLKMPKLTLVDRWVTMAVLYLVAIAQLSVMLQVAERLLGWDDGTVERAEWGMTGAFALILLAVTVRCGLKIQSHYGGAGVAPKDVPPNWHQFPFGIRSYRGHVYRALTAADSTGEVLPQHAIPGQIDPPVDAVSMPLGPPAAHSFENEE